MVVYNRVAQGCVALGGWDGLGITCGQGVSVGCRGHSGLYCRECGNSRGLWVRRPGVMAPLGKVNALQTLQFRLHLRWQWAARSAGGTGRQQPREFHAR